MQSTFVFEFKANGPGDWEALSDDDFMVKMYQHYDKLSPVIRDMLRGKVIAEFEGQYRIRHTSVNIKL